MYSRDYKFDERHSQGDKEKWGLFFITHHYHMRKSGRTIANNGLNNINKTLTS